MKIADAIKFGANQAVVDILKEAGLKQFTAVQEQAIRAGLCNGKSFVIAAPTSSGKTTIAEIAAVDGAIRGKRTVYLVTHKALAEEKYDLFKKSYDTEPDRWFSVSVATGDRVEGDWNDGILVATYEKYLAMISSSNAYSVKDRVVVADEVQIISDNSRGADIEILLSIIRRQIPSQFIALSATAPNADQIAGWLNCDFVNVKYRDVPLRQEVWTGNRRYYNYLGDQEILEERDLSPVSESTLGAVSNLLENGFGPILVFTMTKRDATELAEAFSRSRQQDVKSYQIAEQLELFSEPTGTSETLKRTAERKVAFHSTDLSFSERSVVERALRERNLDVVFSTPTLAAGVNFPIRTVIFDKFSRFWVSGDPWISKAEFLNMSGRAGRLGLDDEGLVVLIARNRTEALKANEFLSPEIEPLRSKLFVKSIRKSVLNLISCRLCKSENEINSFYAETFWWHHNLENNPTNLERIPGLVTESVEWLLENELISGSSENTYPTLLGRSVSSTGLLPSTAIFLFGLLKENEAFLAANIDLPLIHAICSSDEFSEEIGQRFLPYARRNQPETEAWRTLSAADLFINPGNVENYDRVTNASYGIYIWSKGIPERELRRKIPAISYGQLHTLSSEIAWVLDGLSRIVTTPGIQFSVPLATRLNILAEKIRYGVTEEAIDIVKASQKYDVPGLGRQRAMALVAKGLCEPNRIVNSTIDELKKVLQNENRAKSFLKAVGELFANNFSYWRNKHIEKAKSLGVDTDLIKSSYDLSGSAYEEPINSLLCELELNVNKLDTGKRQGVPDFIVTNQGISILLECKTKEKSDATIKKEDAFAVLTKGVDINSDHNVTLGKPDFDTFSKSKAGGARNITLVPHFAFVEAYLLSKEGKVTPDQIFKWFLIPGVATIDSLHNLGNVFEC